MAALRSQAAGATMMRSPAAVKAAAPRVNARLSVRRSPVCRVAAIEPQSSFEGGQSGPVVVAVDAAVTGSAAMPLEDVKAALLDSLYGTERGLAARSEVRAEINELIAQLEAANPTASPAEATEMLAGNWKLVYTSNSELMALLALSRLPFVTIGDITQRIEPATMTVENKVAISVPLTRTAFSTSASFEVRSPKRLQVRFEKGTIATPQLLSEVELPSSLTVMGQALDLSQVKAALTPVNDGFKGLLDRVSDVISQAPALQFPLQPDSAQTWLLTTFLDADTRITRGDGGSVFILVKDVSL